MVVAQPVGENRNRDIRSVRVWTCCFGFLDVEGSERGPLPIKAVAVMCVYLKVKNLDDNIRFLRPLLMKKIINTQRGEPLYYVAWMRFKDPFSFFSFLFKIPVK